MASKRPTPPGKSSRLVDLGPALTGLGTLLAGVAAVIALVVVRPSDAPPSPPPPSAILSPGPGATDEPTSSGPTADPSVTTAPSVAATITVEQLIKDLRALAARTDVPTDPDDYPGYAVLGPKAGMLAEVPKDWPGRVIDLWSDVPPDAPPTADREALGSIIFATTDEEGLYSGTPEAYEIPMFIVTASRRLAVDLRPGSILDMRNVTLGLDCDKETSGPITVGDYRGLYEVFSRCGDSTPMTVQLELLSADGGHVLGATARITTLADITAFERGIDTLRIEADQLLR